MHDLKTVQSLNRPMPRGIRKTYRHLRDGNVSKENSLSLALKYGKPVHRAYPVSIISDYVPVKDMISEIYVGFEEDFDGGRFYYAEGIDNALVLHTLDLTRVAAEELAGLWPNQSFLAEDCPRKLRRWFRELGYVLA